jgi:hypothetical protein
MKFWLGAVTGIAVAAWVYSKMMKGTGSNTKAALVVAGATILAVMLIVSFLPID